MIDSVRKHQSRRGVVVIGDRCILRLVLRAKTTDGSDSVISIGLIMGNTDSKSVNISVIVGIVLGLAVLAALLLPVAIRRRRDSEA